MLSRWIMICVLFSFSHTVFGFEIQRLKYKSESKDFSDNNPHHRQPLVSASVVQSSGIKSSVYSTSTKAEVSFENISENKSKHKFDFAVETNSAPANNELIGIALGIPYYTHPFVSTVGTSNKAGFALSSHFNYSFDNWYLDLSANYAEMEYVRKSSSLIDPIGDELHSYGSDLWAFSLAGGYVHQFQSTTLVFESAVVHTLSDSDNYSERLSMINPSYLISRTDDIENYGATTLISGVSFTQSLDTSFGIIQPYARAYLHYDIDSGSERIIHQTRRLHSGLPLVASGDDDIFSRMHVGFASQFDNGWKGYFEVSSILGLEGMASSSYMVGLSIPIN